MLCREGHEEGLRRGATRQIQFMVLNSCTVCICACVTTKECTETGHQAAGTPHNHIMSGSTSRFPEKYKRAHCHMPHKTDVSETPELMHKFAEDATTKSSTAPALQCMGWGWDQLASLMACTRTSVTLLTRVGPSPRFVTVKLSGTRWTKHCLFGQIGPT